MEMAFVSLMRTMFYTARTLKRLKGRVSILRILSGIKVGTTIYRNYDHKFAKTLQADKTKRLIMVKMQLEETKNGFALSIIDEDGVKVTVLRKVEKSLAKNPATAEEILKKQLTKLGGTLFLCKEFNLIWQSKIFFPSEFL